VVYDDTIIVVRFSTNDNDINNNYNIYKKDKPKAYRWSDGGGCVRMLVL
jgi:hypothetical protein